MPKEQGKLKGVVKSVLFKGVHYETIVETRSGTSITGYFMGDIYYNIVMTRK